MKFGFGSAVGFAAVILGSVIIPAAAQEDMLHVKAYDHANETIHDIKAIGADGQKNDVKAFMDEIGGHHILKVKALIDGTELPVKVVDREGDVYSVKAIRDDGSLMDIKAIAPDGTLLDVKATLASGHILSIRATMPDGSQLPVKAYLHTGHVYDVKGLRLVDEGPAGSHGGTDYFADVKAVLPAHATP